MVGDTGLRRIMELARSAKLRLLLKYTSVYSHKVENLKTGRNLSLGI